MAQEVTVGDKEKLRACKEALSERLGRDRFDVWFSSRVEWKVEADCLKIFFQDDFTRDWCYRRFSGDVSSVTVPLFGDKTKVSFEVASAVVPAQLDLARSSDSRAKHSKESEGFVNERFDTAEGATRDPVLKDLTKLDTATVASTTGLSHGAKAAKRQTGFVQANVVQANGCTSGDVATDTGGDEKRAEERAEVRDVVAFPNKNDRRATESVMPIAKQRALTWENFVSGRCNNMATATAELVLKSPGAVTPLLVYGPCGSGKTHLVQALAQRFRQIHGARRVVYLSSEQFTNDFMEAIRGSGLPSFRRKYRDVECLILDDVQFLAGKRATLQELKHTLDTLLRQGRQVILVADRSLQELSILGPDVQARLTGGMVCPLEGLDEATRRELLGRLIADSRIKLSSKIVRELADRSSGDARVLFGLVNRLRALSLMLGGVFNEQQALEATQDLLTACQPTVRLSDIERAVCDVFGLEPKSLQAKGKTKTVSQPRMLAMFLARKYTRAAYAEIGDYFGHRRHSTVISAEKKVHEWLSDGEAETSSVEVAKIREALRHVEANLRVG